MIFQQWNRRSIFTHLDHDARMEIGSSIGLWLVKKMMITMRVLIDRSRQCHHPEASRTDPINSFILCCIDQRGQCC